jgi:hypothetical protein
MCDEFTLTDPIERSSRYDMEYEAVGQKHSQGRSQRDFGSQTGVSRYPRNYFL